MNGDESSAAAPAIDTAAPAAGAFHAPEIVAPLPHAATPSYVLPETIIIAVIGCLDLLSTVYLLATHHAVEANPLFAGLLERFGPTGFILFKAIMLGGPLTIAELARRQKPAFVKSALRMGIVLYIGFYAISFAQIDVPRLLGM